MEQKKIPTHVVIIPDGNRRWAEMRNMPTLEGHKRGYDRSNELIHMGYELGILIMTFWAFSTENWKRTQEEVGYLMRLFEMMVEKNLREAHEKETRIIHLGRKDRLPDSLLKKIMKAEAETTQYKKHYLCVGIDYGGEDEIIRAFRKSSQSPGDLTKEKLFKLLDTAALPYQQVDLVIRTSGEQRTSGFMPLQTAYAEYCFIKKLFPDFNSVDFRNIINDYSLRNRRFGK